MIITIARTNKTKDGIFGNLSIYPDPFKCVTAENEDLCISPGVYDIYFMWSNKFQQIMPHVIVPGRTAIEIHWANFPSQLEGCIAIGTEKELSQDMITESKDAWIKFVTAISDQLVLKIRIIEDYA